jgi:hypothetical protein
MNFLSSPSVKLVFQEPSAALNKKRQRSGKKLLPGFYEITYRRLIKDYNKDKISQKAYTHRFRYRVRGHFKRFTWGCLMGVSGVPTIFVALLISASHLRDTPSHAKTERAPRVPAEAVYPLWPAHAPQAPTQWTVGKPS